MKDYLTLFTSGFIQVALVALNTKLISANLFVPAIVVGFFISLVWSFNVKKVVFGTWVHRCVYSLGATLGTFIGLVIGNYLEILLHTSNIKS